MIEFLAALSLTLFVLCLIFGEQYEVRFNPNDSSESLDEQLQFYEKEFKRFKQFKLLTFFYVIISISCISLKISELSQLGWLTSVKNSFLLLIGLAAYVFFTLVVLWEIKNKFEITRAKLRDFKRERLFGKSNQL